MYLCRYRLYRSTIAKRTIPRCTTSVNQLSRSHTSRLPCAVLHCVATTREHNPLSLSIPKPHDKCAKVIESDRHVPPCMYWICIRYVCILHICIYMFGLRHAIVSIELLARNVNVSSGNVGIYFFVTFCHDASKLIFQTNENYSAVAYISDAKNLFSPRLSLYSCILHIHLTF